MSTATITAGRTAVADAIRSTTASLKPRPVVYEALPPPNAELGPVAITVASGPREVMVLGNPIGMQRVLVTVRVSTKAFTAQTAQTNLELTVEAADSGIRDGLDGSFSQSRWAMAWAPTLDAYEAQIEFEMFIDDPTPLAYTAATLRPAVFGPARVAIAAALADVSATVLDYDPYPGVIGQSPLVSVTPLALEEYLAYLAVTVSMTDRVQAQATFDSLIAECAAGFETLPGEYGEAQWDSYAWDENLGLWLAHVPIGVFRGTA